MQRDTIYDAIKKVLDDKKPKVVKVKCNLTLWIIVTTLIFVGYYIYECRDELLPKLIQEVINE